jgi:hypothetical protein
MSCHNAAGIQSVLSYSQVFSSAPTLVPPKYEEAYPARLQELTEEWKKDQYNWGYLNGLWQGRSE